MFLSNAELPDHVQKQYSDQCQSAFREAWNTDFDLNRSDMSAFNIAYASAHSCMMHKEEGVTEGTIPGERQ